jgi:superfamily II DNA or RNA helicase
VSFASLISATKLRTLADRGYERGLAYFEGGQVLSCEVVGDGIEGMVAGTTSYRVRVFAPGRKLAWECTCPVSDAMCKHAVALCLFFLSDSQIAELDGVPQDEPARKPGKTAQPFATTAELTAWAKEHEVEHELITSALVVMPEVAEVYRNPTGLHYMLARLTLRDIGSVEAAGRYLGVRQVQQPAAEAARAYLARAAADVQRGIAEEEAQSTDVPKGLSTEQAPIATLWQRLVGIRAELRRRASPRSKAARAEGELRFDPNGLALVWTERAIAGGHVPGLGVFHAHLALHPMLDLRCSCSGPPRHDNGWRGAMRSHASAEELRAMDAHDALHASTAPVSAIGRAGCTHLIALVDTTFELLADPARRDRAMQYAEELTRPGWQRAIAAMTALDEKADAPTADIEVWWEVDNGYGGATLMPVVKKRLKKGGWSAGTRVTPQRMLADHGAALTESDAKIAEHVASFVPVHRSSTYPARAFMALVGHPRVRLAEGEQLVSVRRFPLGFSALPSGEMIRVEPAVDGARFSPRLLAPLLEMHAHGEPLLVIEPEHERVMLIDASDSARALWATFAKHGDVFPPESHDALLTQLGKLERRLPMSVPHQLKGARLVEKITVVMRVRITPEDTLELEAFIRPAPGSAIFPPNVGPRDVMIAADGQRGYVRRTLDTELPRVREMLARLPLDAAEEGPPLIFSIADADAALELVAVLQNPPEGIEAEWVDRKTTVVGTAGPRALRLNIDRKHDWFGIEGQLVIDGARLELAALLDAVRRQRKFVRIDENRWVELSAELRRRLVSIADQTYETKNAIELSPAAAPAIREAEAEGVQIVQAPAWQDLATRFAASSRLRPKPPAGLVATLREYQIEGHAWLSRVAAWGAGACLADDMGLGKTIQAIAVLLDRAKKGAALVLAPTSVTLNWVDELRRFAPTLNPIVYGEGDRTSKLSKLGKHDVLIVSYGLLHRDIDALASRVFTTLIIDEAQALKNHTTQRSRAARRLQAEFRIAMSGTPIENNLGELWALFAVIFPGLLGSWDQFRDRYAFPIERQNSSDARAALSRVITPFLLRRTKSDVARELPSRTEIQVPISLSTEEMTIYEDSRLAAVAILARQVKKTPDNQQRFQVLAALTRLRLLASHPRLHDNESPIASSKMQRLLELLDELRASGHRALVFSQFTRHLSLVQDELTKAGFAWLYLDGATPMKERKKLIDRFQAGEGDAFLISLKAGGTGINLTAADYVIHLDPWWNPAVEDQATDRAHRIGQTKPVTVYRLIARNTVEERILQMHHGKRALVAGVLDGTDQAAKLTTKDLMALLG